MMLRALGFLVALAGTAAASPDHDVNGDGFDDAIIGRSALYLGSAHGLVAAKAMPHVPRGDVPLVSSVVIVGDVNGDGFADVVFGDPACRDISDDIGACDVGQIHLFLGGPKGLAATPAQTISAKAKNTWFGAQVIAAGDLDGDHHADIALVDHEGIHVYLGTATGFAVTPIDLPGTNAFAIGDLDHDGKSELLVTDQAVARIYRGGGLEDSEVVPIGAHVRLQDAVGHGDFDGDGFGDLAITVRHDDRTTEVLIFRGSAKGLVATPVARMTLGPPRAGFGNDFGSVGDLDGDGRDDLVIESSCAVFDAKAGSCTASLAVFLGSATGLHARPIATLAPTRTNMSIGDGLAALGDIDGDQHADFAVGAYVYRGAKGGLASTKPPSL